MEQRIKAIIESLEKFVSAEFLPDDEKNPDSNLYYVQLIERESNIWEDKLNFDSRVDVLISYCDNQINIYAKISDKFVEKDFQDLINKLSKEFPISSRFSNRPSIYRFDTLNIKEENQGELN